MSKQLFLLLAVFVMASIAYKTVRPEDSLTHDLLFNGMKQEYIDQFLKSQKEHEAHMKAAAEEEKNTGKKGLREAAFKKDREAMMKMHESWPKEQNDILGDFVGEKFGR
ncbi:hypothetical protein CAEBREN_22970 [Caenorhabditis brenneri]|uniref:Uncharacterized protein n=1 Tax=Caenorhabditis brenneri TaxID=135651 RepID=G0NCP3_CAEBE|nr:hypothetical protein CAEBREN_22970 [Caenorhabditis brenneri]